MEQTYTTVQGDMWDSISHRVYGSEKYMGHLMQANPDLLHIFIFGAGTVLTVPALETEADPDLPVWR